MSPWEIVPCDDFAKQCLNSWRQFFARARRVPLRKHPRVQSISEVRTEGPQTPNWTHRKEPTPSLVTNLSPPVPKSQSDEQKSSELASTLHAFWIESCSQHSLNPSVVAAQFRVQTLPKILAEMRMRSRATIASTHHFLRRRTPWHKQRVVEPLCKDRNCCVKIKHKEIYKNAVYMPCTLCVFVFQVHLINIC